MEIDVGGVNGELCGGRRRTELRKGLVCKRDGDTEKWRKIFDIMKSHTSQSLNYIRHLRMTFRPPPRPHLRHPAN